MFSVLVGPGSTAAVPSAGTAETFAVHAVLRGHRGMVTSLSCTRLEPSVLLSGSRDKSVMVWRVDPQRPDFGVLLRALRGHSHYVQDVVISADAQYAMSASWDGSLRLWELKTGRTTRRYVGHTSDVLSVAFSADNRFIISSSRDRTIRLWNTLAECKRTFTGAHDDWISCVRFNPDARVPRIVSVGWDKVVRIWEVPSCRVIHELCRHTDYISTVTISPDGTICASGGRDGQAIIWDIQQGTYLDSMLAGSPINALCFNPYRYWLCVGTDDGIFIYDLESKKMISELLHTVQDFKPVHKKHQCTALAWGRDGTILYAGYADGYIRIWSHEATNAQALTEGLGAEAAPPM